MELDFIKQSLTNGQPWGTYVAVKGAICTYSLGTVDTMEDGGKSVGKVVPGLLYAIDYDAETSSEWTAFHLPAGGVGFGRTGSDDFDRPDCSGLCFRQQASGQWAVVAQASAGI